ncbi:NAD+ synthase [Carboxydothermus hydrogenoformans]|uniref:NH(3)-dependent NAD(+) synthetase n=1 Tax=Carboxydothermus hydrogenoformans (strain ATCC BAA-161 / DSM 6008 / Z-2901) TaxID=246194 RepID=NADE_CARHZ|nr:NAD+ synthase [Carboxydothermus hydrogenoformans]Q3ABX6.1 RecName: Full=NH(3)-dependent NAD(+) synthetase [Carboxydothermus hydrogenoformans Z-2901]ABB13788.1 NAD+ synthetase [Carboxydothermus hydrogenoformans Z-2901]
MRVNWEEKTEKLVNWLREKTREANASGLLVGLSGGVDSAVVATLIKKAFPEKSLGIIMPCFSNPEDEEDARMIANHLNLKYIVVNLDEPYQALVSSLKNATPHEPEKLALANIKPRLRMTTLYYWAANLNYLVAGTGNRTELEIGYFTKWGDGGVDLLPIGNLTKTEVWEFARYLGLPEKIITKAPSAGLWEGQTDEGEMGFTYKDIDHYLLTGEGSAELVDFVKRMQRKSQHKKRIPEVPML